MDKDEFCEQIRLYEKSMYYVAMSVVRNEADAGDVISEAIYRAYKSLPALKHKRFFKAWILRIVHNTAVEWIRKNARLVQMEAIEENIEEQSVHDDLTMKVTLKEQLALLNSRIKRWSFCFIMKIYLLWKLHILPMQASWR